jgi:hypothetical protein
MKVQFSEQVDNKAIPQKTRERMKECIELANESQKFMLPEGGAFYDDPEYKAIDDSERVRLPFKNICLEYHRDKPEKFDGDWWSSKALIFASEIEEFIFVTVVCYIDDHKIWVPFPEIAIPNINFIVRDRKVKGLGYDGIEKEYASVRFVKEDQSIPDQDYGQEMYALLNFINILNCSNVKIEKNTTKEKSKKIKTALPFDSYHVLVIDSSEKKQMDQLTGTNGGHRSPREHLRRGHIRRLSSGKKVWVNAAVVNAGRMVGVIHKYYAIKHAA